MDLLTIHTGLDGFVLLDAVTETSEDRIAGEARFSGADPFLLLEALAQLGGLHVRAGLDFSKQVFLIRVSDSSLPAGEALDGRYRLRGNRIGGTDKAFEYALEASLEDDVVLHQGRFLFGAMDYQDEALQSVQQEHYRKVFACLNKS